jgi:ABC-type nitrate/sulfonate/bicarbonate transport system substrate-binding protein
MRLWADGIRDTAALREEALRRRGENKLTFGIVFEHSMHHVLLRQWLRDARLDPDRDVRIAVVPPAQMFRNLVAGTLDGYCAGEPWNTLAVQQRGGWCPSWSAALSPGHVEKVLMVRAGFAARYADEHGRLIAALVEAARWCDEPGNRAEVAKILSAPAYLDLPAEVIAPTLLGHFSPHPGQEEPVPDFHVFSKGDANAPTAARAATLQAELVAAGLVPRGQLSSNLPKNLFREDLYRQALTHTDLHANASQPSDGAFLPA